jgi:hypothetical protein
VQNAAERTKIALVSASETKSAALPKGPVSTVKKAAAARTASGKGGAPKKKEASGPDLAKTSKPRGSGKGPAKQTTAK